MSVSGRKRRGLRPRSRIVASIVGFLGLFVCLGAWAISSPVGGSPDEDYHLASIWCPRYLDAGQCDPTWTRNERVSVEVPSAVKDSSACFAFKPQKSAECTDWLSDSEQVRTTRFDEGGYPIGYYQFQHVFVGPDVHHSVVVMRLVNVALVLGGLSGVMVLARRDVARVLFVGAVAAWVPMGIYFVSSVNPSAWAIGGCLIYAGSLLGAASSTGRRRRALLVFAVYGALLAGLSRGDSAFYIFVISLAAWFFIPRLRQCLSVVVTSVICSAYGLVSVLSTGQAAALSSDGGWPTDQGSSLFRIALANFNSLPEYFGSMWGLNSGPGWVDVALSGWSTLTMLALFGGLVLVGTKRARIRNILSATIVLGAIAGIPVVTMTIRRVHPLTYYQGRYMLPLLAVLLLFWLFKWDAKGSSLSGGQVALVLITSGIAHAAALRRLILRYASGIDGPWPGGLRTPQWWPWSVGPKTVLMVAVVLFVLSLALIAAVLWASAAEVVHEGATARTRVELNASPRGQHLQADQVDAGTARISNGAGVLPEEGRWVGGLH